MAYSGVVIDYRGRDVTRSLSDLQASEGHRYSFRDKSEVDAVLVIVVLRLCTVGCRSRYVIFLQLGLVVTLVVDY